MEKKLVIVGAGEFAQIAFEYFTHDSERDVVAFSVEPDYIDETSLYELPVVPLEQLAKEFPPSDCDVFVAVTQTQLNRVRMRLYRKVKELGYKCANYLSSNAFVWRNVVLGENCFVFENNVLQPFVRVGNNVILWSGNHIGHRTVIEDHCFFSSHVVVSGYCHIGERSFMGVNSTLADHVQIAPDNLIGAGAVVTKSTEPDGIYRGNPATLANVGAKRYFKVEEERSSQMV